jgi:hypothetical protein
MYVYLRLDIYENHIFINKYDSGRTKDLAAGSRIPDLDLKTLHFGDFLKAGIIFGQKLHN